ncbi:MAG: hypothetical protein M0T79_00690 [Actinomycetota bacterium]|nr:hypothetical protein [Actinomycetota bacterium]
MEERGVDGYPKTLVKEGNHALSRIVEPSGNDNHGWRVARGLEWKSESQLECLGKISWFLTPLCLISSVDSRDLVNRKGRNVRGVVDHLGEHFSRGFRPLILDHYQTRIAVDREKVKRT